MKPHSLDVSASLVMKDFVCEYLIDPGYDNLAGHNRTLGGDSGDMSPGLLKFIGNQGREKGYGGNQFTVIHA